MTKKFGTVVIEKRGHGKNMRLSVRQDGTVRLSIPRFVTFAAAREFLASKQKWIEAACKRAASRPPRLLEQGSAEEYATHKEAARQLITARVEYFSTVYGTEYRSLSIRNQRSRFGSCSARGHLSFNYRLIFLPDHLCDYVVAHEVCHLLELNHSPKFWLLVARTIPDFQERKHELQAFSRPSH